MSHGSIRTRRTTLTREGVLAAGFVGLATAVLVAVANPASGYEPSIYGATPAAVWAGIAVAFVAAALVAFRTEVTDGTRRLALVLAGAAGWTAAALPLLRGYFFYGQGDALSHLGFARSFGSGALEPTTLLHPGVHLSSLLLGGAAGIPLRRAMLITVFAFVLAFLVFTPLCVRELADARGATAVGLFAAVLLLPLNGVGTHIVAHPSSQTILFVPVVLYVLFRYVRSAPAGRFKPTALGGLLALVTGTTVLLHPQEAMSLAVIFGSVALVQLLASRYRPGSTITGHRRIYAQTAFLLGIWLLWAPRSPRVQGRVERAAGLLSGGPQETAAGAAASGASVALASIGGSIQELFVKLFLGSLLFSLIAGPVMLGSVLGWFDRYFPERNALNKYLAVAFLPLLVGTGFVFVGPFGDHYMRFAGFLMMVVTLVAAAALVDLVPEGVGVGSERAVRVAVVVFLLALLPVATLGLHPSPWIYQDTEQVTAQDMEGFERAFEHNPGDIPMSGIRGNGERYAEAIYGPESTTATTVPGEPLPFSVFGNNVTDYYDDATYVPVRRSDVYRETGIYDGLRYGESGFRDLERTPGINRVQSTGGFRLYMLPDR